MNRVGEGNKFCKKYIWNESSLKPFVNCVKKKLGDRNFDRNWEYVMNESIVDTLDWDK